MNSKSYQVTKRLATHPYSSSKFENSISEPIKQWTLEALEKAKIWMSEGLSANLFETW